MIWIDLTYSLRLWKKPIAGGIARAELELAHHLFQVDPTIRFFTLEKNGFIEVDSSTISWLLTEDNLVGSYMQYQKSRTDIREDLIDPNWPDGLKHAFCFPGFVTGRMARIIELARIIYHSIPRLFRYLLFIPGKLLYYALLLLQYTRRLLHPSAYLHEEPTRFKQTVDHYPFSDDDIICNFGYHQYDERIQYAYSELKELLPGIRLIFTVYDLVYVNKDTSALFDYKQPFSQLLFWLSTNVDWLIYGGTCAKDDVATFLRKHHMRVPDGTSVRWGNPPLTHHSVSTEDVLKKYDIQTNYILSVGSIIPKKNYSLLYKAYCHLLDSCGEAQLPMLIIAGSTFGGIENQMLREFQATPKVSNMIRIISPTDTELDFLYRHCLFTLLPSWWEGYSLTLPEALSYGKMCLSSDIPPLREIADGLTVFLPPDDPIAWAEAIRNYSSHPELVEQYEQRIGNTWHTCSWADSASEVHSAIRKCEVQKALTDRNLCYDLTTVFVSTDSHSSPSGILRSQMLIYRHLLRQYPHIRTYAFSSQHAVRINRQVLLPMLSNETIDDVYYSLDSRLTYYNCKDPKSAENRNAYIMVYWLICSLMPRRIRDGMIRYVENRHVNKKTTPFFYPDLPFRDGDVLCSVGVGFGNPVYEALKRHKQKTRFSFVQLIYDYTPILFPQYHPRERCVLYANMLENTYKTCDYLLYGGATAQADGIQYGKDMGYPSIPSSAVYFGSNIEVQQDEVSDDSSRDEEGQEILESLGINGDYILTVGSIEPRKNHETLYLALLDLVKKHGDDVPQIVFAGYPGWNREEFVQRIHRDDRINGKLLHITPNDRELHLLYKNCLFTILSSVYEGWSLTLPESLNYGKFCLCADNAPLREAAGDLADYVPWYDTVGWSEKIHEYYTNRDKLHSYEARIETEWHPITWQDCAAQIGNILLQQAEDFS